MFARCFVFFFFYFRCYWFLAVCCFYFGRTHSHWLLFKFCLKLCSPLRIYCWDGCLLLPKRLMVENSSGIIGPLSDHIRKIASTSCLSTISSFHQMFIKWVEKRRKDKKECMKTHTKTTTNPGTFRVLRFFSSLKLSSVVKSFVHRIFASLLSQEKQCFSPLTVSL